MKKKLKIIRTNISGLLSRKRLVYFILIVIIIFLLTYLKQKIDFSNPYLGFGEFSKNEFYRPSKTLWDWLELLIVPITLVLGGYFLNRFDKKHERRIVDERISSEQDIAEARNQEIALREYIDRISELLIDKNLQNTNAKSAIANVATIRTLNILRRLSSDRNRLVIYFLYDSGLLKLSGYLDPIISLKEADQINLNLYAANLPGINLKSAKLKNANLQFTILTDSLLNGADLRETNLQLTNFTNAQLELVDFRDANLNLTVLYDTNLKGSNFNGADLRDTMFVRANIEGANFLNCKSLTQEQIDEAFYFDNPPILPYGLKPPPKKEKE